MSARATTVAVDRSDFRSVMIGGTKLGLTVGVAVVVFLFVSRLFPPGVVRSIAQTIVVVIAGAAAAFLPARWVAPRTGDGLAGAAAVGLWGTVVFSAFDIVLLRPFDAYPWTWDAVGGNSTWWYLPMWWMLGTLAAWLGAIAGSRAPTDTPLARLALPAAIGGLAGAVVAGVAGWAVAPVGAGAGMVVVIAARAIAALARRA